MRRVSALDVPFDPWPTRWLWPRDLQFPDSGHQWGDVEVPTGVVSERGWFVFHRRQVLVVVPDEVHTYWHHDLAGDAELPGFTPWRIVDSQWLRSLAPQHLGRCEHFVLDLKDFVVEVICEALLFGEGPFDLERAIELHPALADAHFFRGRELEKAGDIAAARVEFAKAASANGASSRDAAAAAVGRLEKAGPGGA